MVYWTSGGNQYFLGGFERDCRADQGDAAGRFLFGKLRETVRYAGRSAVGFFIEEADILLWEKQTEDMLEGAPWDFY